VFVAIAALLADDRDARETLSRAAARTVRRGVDVGAWVAVHLVLADRLLQVIRKPEEFTKPNRAPLPGDLVILGSALDPRVRVALDVLPSESTNKIKVRDPEAEAHARQFVATHVNYVAWWEREQPKRVRTGNLAP